MTVNKRRDGEFQNILRKFLQSMQVAALLVLFGLLRVSVDAAPSRVAFDASGDLWEEQLADSSDEHDLTLLLDDISGGEESDDIAGDGRSDGLLFPTVQSHGRRLWGKHSDTRRRAHSDTRRRAPIHADSRRSVTHVTTPSRALHPGLHTIALLRSTTPSHHPISREPT